MSQLRWILIGLGALFLAGLALWEWRRGRRQPAREMRAEPKAPDITLRTERPRRLEPGLAEFSGVLAVQSEDPLDVPTILPVEPLRVATQSAIDVPAAARGADGDAIAAAQVATVVPLTAAPITTVATATAAAVAVRWPPREAARVLTLRIVKPEGAMPGRPLRAALEFAGLASGPQQIYHRADTDGAVIVSAANLVQPGTLDPAHMDAEEYRGIALFSVLPGPLAPVRMLEELVATARSVAHRLGAIVQDEDGADLDGPRLTELRRSLPEGGGAVPAGKAP